VKPSARKKLLFLGALVIALTVIGVLMLLYAQTYAANRGGSKLHGSDVAIICLFVSVIGTIAGWLLIAYALGDKKQ
jgi:hypothetical protein